MAKDFLYKEYDLCFKQLNFYDERQSNLLKFVFWLTSSLITVSFAALKFIETPTDNFYLFIAALSTLAFFVLLNVYVTLISNRLYFVFMARQVNALRKYFLFNEAQEFRENNQLYLSTDFSAAKVFSLQILQMVGVTAISTLFVAVAISSIFHVYPNVLPSWCAGLIVVLLFLIQIVGGYFFLNIKGNQSSDKAIHNKQQP